MSRRYFVRPLPPPGAVLLSRQLGHHLGRIVRRRPGDAVVLFDGEGCEVAAVVVEVAGRELQVEVVGLPTQPHDPAARLALDVAVALPKSPRTDWLLEHGTEAGIRRFRPILTARTNRQASRQEHWQRVVIAAAAQCGRAVLPRIEPIVSLRELCASELPQERYVANFAADELGAATAAAAILVVGPEGGLTDAELEQLTNAGFVSRSLGELTLRTETAVLAGATRLMQRPTR